MPHGFPVFLGCSEVRSGCCLKTSAPWVRACTCSFKWLVVAFILRGLKEFGEPTRKALIMDLSPDGCRAGMFGLYYLIRDVFVSVAAFGGAFLWQISPQTNLLTAFVFGLIGTAGFALFGRDLPVPNPTRNGPGIKKLLSG